MRRRELVLLLILVLLGILGGLQLGRTIVPPAAHAQIYIPPLDPCLSPYATKKSFPINLTSATTTSLVAVSGTTSIYVCGATFTIAPSGTSADTIAFEYGTGAACSSPTLLTGTFGNGDLTTTVGVTPITFADPGTTMTAPSANGLCALTAGTTVNIQGVGEYVQQ